MQIADCRGSGKEHDHQHAWLQACFAASVTDFTAPACLRSSLLSGNRTSRLYRALVQPGRATSANAVAGYPGEKHPGTFPRLPRLPAVDRALICRRLLLTAFTLLGWVPRSRVRLSSMSVSGPKTACWRRISMKNIDHRCACHCRRDAAVRKRAAGRQPGQPVEGPAGAGAPAGSQRRAARRAAACQKGATSGTTLSCAGSGAPSPARRRMLVCMLEMVTCGGT